MKVPFDACPLCACPRSTHLRDTACTHHPGWSSPLPSALTWRQCDRCSHVFTDGYFTDEAADVMLANSSPLRDIDPERNRVRWAETVASVAALIPTGRWLDVGPGDGGAMAMADEWGFEVSGIDVRQEVVDAVTGFGLDCQRARLHELPGKGWVDVLTMFDVLEHCPFPGDELDDARRLLRHQGVLVVACPNMASVAWAELDKHHANPYWAEIEHCHNFTRQRLVALLYEHGFEPSSFNISNRWRLGMEIIARRR